MALGILTTNAGPIDSGYIDIDISLTLDILTTNTESIDNDTGYIENEH